MVYIFHGENLQQSREAFNNFLDSKKNIEISRLDNKSIDLDKINNFLQGSSLFETQKILAISNLFSIPKINLDKLIKILHTSSDIDIVIWQDKKLSATQLKTFSPAKIEYFHLDNRIFLCINSIKPNNYNYFHQIYQEILKNELYDLFLYLLKTILRKQIQTFSKFNSEKLKQAYIKLIELEYHTKTGKISSPKEIILEKIIYDLVTTTKVVYNNI